ncbi:MAG TPA: ABC transporter permease [Terriglobia bacterium]|nr:ABC transporter permease [Terriglobia bacterium]
MQTFLQDLRYAFRTLSKSPGFTIFAILIVGLGIGASATVFSVVNALLLRPLPFNNPGRLVWIENGGKEGDLSGLTVQVGHFLDYREQNKSFEDLAAYFAFYGVGDNKLTGVGEPERLSGVPVSQNFFQLLGIQPQLGRLFTDDECKWNGPKAVLLSYGFWKRRFAADSGIIGRSITLNDVPHTVVGVLPASFDFANIFAPGSHFDLYFPFPLSPETNRWGNTLAIVGRLKPGATVRSAQAEADILGPQIRNQHPERNGFRPRLSLLKDHVSARLRPALIVLACAVGVVMLIVCANLSNLLLARTAARQKEMAIRAALGAGKWRLIRQMLTESVLLSSCGAVLGIILAFAGTRVLAHLNAISIPLLASVHVDARALTFTGLIALLTGLFFGLAPALHVPGAAINDSLKDTHRGSSGGKKHAWIRGVLVVSEIAFASVLLVGAGLLIRSFLKVLDVDLGFQPERAGSLRVDPSSQYSTQALRNAYFNEVLRRVRTAPGIEGAGLSDDLPLGVNRSWDAGAKGQAYAKGQYPEAFPRMVSDGYLGAMGIPLKAGRDFTEADNLAGPPVIIVNETLAKRLWPGQNPIGQTIVNDCAPERQVVGVVGDVRHIALEQSSGSEMYIPILQCGDNMAINLVVRSTLPPAAMASAVRDALKPLDPNLPANEFRPLQTLVDKAVSPRRFILILLSGFSAFALILASLGIYAVVSYSVSQRTQEFGIRMALGAQPRDVLRLVLGRGLMLALTGAGAGLIGALALTRLMASMLYGVQPDDFATFMVVLLVLGCVALAANYIPAYRATKIDPMVALRYE